MSSKVSALSTVAALAGDELLLLVDDPSGTPASKKVALSEIVPAGGTTGQVLAKTSNTAYDLEWAAAGGSIPGAWSSYTPGWITDGAGADPTLGNGTLTGAYVQIGKTVHFRIKFVRGSTSTNGSGAWAFSLPVAPHADYSANTSILVNGYAEDSGVAGHNIGGGRMTSTASYFILHNGTTGNGYSGTVPFTWSTSDYLNVSGTYEAA